MSPLRTALVLGVLIGFLTRCPAQVPPATPPAPAPAAANPAKALAEGLLDQALDKLRSLPWMETRIRHEMNSIGVKVEVTGQMITAAGNKVYYEREVNVGGAKGSIKIVSNGRTSWHIQQLDAGQTAIETIDLAGFDEATAGSLAGVLLALGAATGHGPVGRHATWFAGPPGGTDDIDWRVREELLSNMGFVGIQPALMDVRKRITFERVELTLLPGKDPVPVYRLEGKWNKKTLDGILGNRPEMDLTGLWEKRQVYPLRPRGCRLYLGRESWWLGGEPLWPYRLEWVGPTRAGGEDEVLVAVEFQQPRFQPRADADRIFTFQAPLDEAVGQTVKISKEIERRRERLKKLKELEEEAKSR